MKLKTEDTGLPSAGKKCPDDGQWVAWSENVPWQNAIRIAFGRTEDIAVSRWYALYGHEEEKHDRRGQPDLVNKEALAKKVPA